MNLFRRGVIEIRKLFAKTTFFALTFVLTLLLVLNPTVDAKQTTATTRSSVDLSTVKIHGKYDFKSSDLTTVIVELEEQSLVQAKHSGVKQSKETLKLKRDLVLNQVDRLTNGEVEREYDYLFSGFALEIPMNELLSLQSIPGIKAVYPNVHYTTDDVEMTMSEVFKPEMVDSNPYVGAWDAYLNGITGAGVTVAVIDTGSDYTHPELQHAFGEYKGYDFYDDDPDPMEGPGQYHGTHVSGTIAAYSFGIAPEARLLAYRVLGPNGGSSLQVIAGIEQAVKDGADVMNLSLGNTLNDPDYATSIALDWAMAEGVVAVTSNGNDGPDLWTVGSPGSSRDAISVGSSALPTQGFENLNLFTSEGVEYPSLTMAGADRAASVNALNGNTYEFVYVGLGGEDDFTDVDVAGKIALIKRGEHSFTDKNYNAYTNGAVGVILFNNVDEELSAGGTWYLPVFQLSLSDGEKMLNEIENGNNQVTISADAYEIGETISDFSSRGPVYGTWMIKPDILAPGDSIYSTVPVSLGGYGYAGGTSMASPHVAGAAALILQVHPNYSPKDVKAALMNTAVDLVDPLTGELYPHNEQGAGSMRIMDAIYAETLVTPGSYSFGKFIKNNGKQVEGQSFEIKNLSDERKTYTFEVQFNGNPAGIKVMTSNNTKVKANGTQQVNFNVQVDTKKLAAGFYEGTITVSDGEQTIVVPTILFVQEPDYPRVAGAGVEAIGDGMYVAFAEIMSGAEYIRIDFYNFNANEGTIGDYLTSLPEAYNVPNGFYEELWDGTVNGEKLAPGYYVIAVYVVSNGVTEYVPYLFEITE
jgi:minor extracellular serine protease Vpr